MDKIKLDFKIPDNFFSKEYSECAKFIKEKIKKQRIPSIYKKWIQDSISKHNSRVKSTPTTIKGIDALVNKYTKKSINIIESIFPSLYRCTNTKWAGGNNTFNISDKVYTSSKVKKVWSKNGKWSGTDVDFSINISKTWYSSVYLKGIHELEGMLTTHAQEIPGNDNIRLFKAKWIEQQKGYSIRQSSGYIAFNEEFGAYHSPSAKSAINGLRRRMNTNTRPEIPLMSYIRKKYGKLLVSLKDSLSVGNCENGTRNWCEVVGIDFSKKSCTLSNVIDGYYIRPSVRVLNVIKKVYMENKS